MYINEITIKFNIENSNFEVHHCGQKKFESENYAAAAGFLIDRLSQEFFGQSNPRIVKAKAEYDEMLALRAINEDVKEMLSKEPGVVADPLPSYFDPQTEPLNQDTVDDLLADVEVPEDAVAQVREARLEEEVTVTAHEARIHQHYLSFE